MLSKRKLWQKRIVALRTKEDANLREVQSNHKHEYNRRIRKILSFLPVSYVLLYNPTKRTISDGSAEAIAKHTYDKL